MRDLNNLDMQLAVQALSDQTRMVLRGVWKSELPYYSLTVAPQGYARRIVFTLAERDLVMAHLAVLGHA